MSRPIHVLVAASLMVLLAAPGVQAGHDDCEGFTWGADHLDTCVRTGLDFNTNAPLTISGLGSWCSDAPLLGMPCAFTGRVEVTIEDPDTGDSATGHASFVGGVVVDESGLGNYPATDVTVSVDILHHDGVPPVGPWKVAINHA